LVLHLVMPGMGQRRFWFEVAVCGQFAHTEPRFPFVFPVSPTVSVLWCPGISSVQLDRCILLVCKNAECLGSSWPGAALCNDILLTF
jgi:hypothetical protein